LCISQEWQRGFEEALLASTGREAALAELAERLEQDLQLLGATAVEDRLQEGVPQAIATLLRAGLKVPAVARIMGPFTCCCHPAGWCTL
jgi:phospholipid-translocating ATPase